MKALIKRYYLVHIVNDEIRYNYSYTNLEDAIAKFKVFGFENMRNRRIDETLEINDYNMAYMVDGDRHEIKILIEI